MRSTVITFFKRYITLLLFLFFITLSSIGIFKIFISRVIAVHTNNSFTSWGLSFQNDGEAPIGNASAETLSTYNAYYLKNTKEKTIFLTFDVGYENGNTIPILEALKLHDVKATFFVVGSVIRDNPDIILKIVEYGHTVGNHTMTHPDPSNIVDPQIFYQELKQVENLYKSLTHKEMTKFYRPPQGIYSIENLLLAKNLGYTTFFWSLAYVDWYQNKQPSKGEAFSKLLNRIHPGAIVLLHSTSSTNAAILDELLERWKNMGYTFDTLDHVCQD